MLNKITAHDLDMCSKDDYAYAKARAITFFENLWNGLEVPPVKQMYTRLSDMKSLVMKGIVNDQEKFILLKTESATTRPRFLGDYDYDSLFSNEGSEHITYVYQKRSGVDIDIIVYGDNATSVLCNQKNQLYPSRLLSLLEQQPISVFDDVRRMMHLMRISKK